MANQPFNIVRGKIGERMDPAEGLAAAASRHVIVVLEAAEADDTLRDHDDLAVLLGAAGNTEATAAGYARVETAAAGITYSIDDTANSAKVVKDADETFSSVTGNAFVKLLCCYDADQGAGTDTDIEPLTHHDFAVTPNGGDITADFDQTNGFWDST